jgi:hypothetical protein
MLSTSPQYCTLLSLTQKQRCDSPHFSVRLFWRFFCLSLVSVSYPIRYDQSKSHDRSPLIKVKEKNCLASSLLTVAVSLLPSLSSAVHCCAGLVLRRKFSRFQLEARGGVVGTKPVVSAPLEARWAAAGQTQSLLFRSANQ